MAWVEPRARLSWCEELAVRWSFVGGTRSERYACMWKLLSWTVVAVGELGTRLRWFNGLVYTECLGHAIMDSSLTERYL